VLHILAVKAEVVASCSYARMIVSVFMRVSLEYEVCHVV
jgi:hypothetical protein